MLDNSGKPTGIFVDNALDLVTPVIPPLSEKDEDEYDYCHMAYLVDTFFSAVDRAVAVLLQNGITSVHHMGTWENVAPLKRAHASGRLKVRVKASLPLASWQRVADMVQKEGAGDSKLRFSSVKGTTMGRVDETDNAQATLTARWVRYLH